MKVPIKSPVAKISHPDHPEIVATLRRVTNTQRLIMQERAIKLLRDLIPKLPDATNAETMTLGEALALAMETAPMMPYVLESTRESLRGPLVAISGLEDETTGQPVELSEGNFSDVLDALYAPTFVVKGAKSTDVKGNPITQDMQFPMWLVMRLNDATTFGTGDLSPKESQPQ